jgi:gliding motility-associated-like protein
MRTYLSVAIIFLCFFSQAQQFQNPDLEGQTIPEEFSILPMFWQAISALDPRCEANSLNITDTADLTDETAPKVSIGACGTPYSGNTFVSGMYYKPAPDSYYHEGIKQTVNGFEVDSFYTISLYQAVIKQNNVEDPTGRWMIFLDNETIPRFTTSSSSDEAYNSLNTPWDFRTITFQAYATSHTFYFLPYDNDLSQGYLLPGELGGVRMGIDSIYLHPSCEIIAPLMDTITLCEETSVLLEVTSPNASYQWQDGSTGSSIVAVEGDYSVIIRGVDGCLSYEEVSVVRNEVKNLNLGVDTTFCISETLLLNPGLEDVTYQWQNGSNSTNYLVEEEGLYWVEASQDVCVQRDSIVIVNNEINDYTLGSDTTLCFSAPLLLTAPTINGVSYLWQDNSDELVFQVTEAGTYWLEATNNNCTIRDSINVFSAFPAFSLGQDTTLCTGESLLLDATLPNTTYLWQDGSTTPTFLATSGGTYTVALNRADCTIYDTLQITELSFGALDLGVDTTLCPGSSLTLTAEIPGANYIWQNQSTVANFTLSAPGLYWVTASLENCTATDSILVSPHPLNQVDLGEEQTICAGDTLLLNAAQNGASYSWQDGSSSSSYEVTAPGNYSVTVSLGECSSSDDVQVVNSLLQPFDLGPDLTLCQGETHAMTGPAIAESYSWSTGANTASITVGTAGTYQLTTTLGGCTEEDELVLSYNPLAPFSLGVDTTLCLGDSLLLIADIAAAEILWSDGTTGNTLWVNTPGNYGLTLTLDDCTQNSSLEVDYYEATSLELGQNITICEGQPLVLAPEISGPPPTFLWQDGTSTATYEVQNSGTYTLMLTNICETATDAINVTIEECTCEVYLPNAFSPNGDGTNDTFRSYTTCPITDYEIQIFDRWGGLRFTSNSIENGWQGLEVNTGVYLYTLRYRDRDGQWQQRVGEVHLLR